MIFKQVTFISINPKCVSLKPVRYNIDTVCEDSAIRKAKFLLNEECEHADRYRLLSVIDKQLHHHVC